MNITYPPHRGKAVSKGMNAKVAAGFVVGAARVGYVAVRTEDGIQAVPDPALTPLLGEAFRMVRDGKSLRSVTAWLQTKNVCGLRGDPISLATVQRMLTDPYYCGLIRDGARGWKPGSHKESVDPKLFAEVQRKLLSRRCRPAAPSEEASSRGLFQ